MSENTSMTQDELDDQTLEAFKAWRKDNSIVIESKRKGEVGWNALVGDPYWIDSSDYRIEPQERTISVWQEFTWAYYDLVYVFVPHLEGRIIAMCRDKNETKWVKMREYTFSVKDIKKITAKEVNNFVDLNDARCVLGNQL